MRSPSVGDTTARWTPRRCSSCSPRKRTAGVTSTARRWSACGPASSPRPSGCAVRSVERRATSSRISAAPRSDSTNQGWKDSWDGISFADGRLPSGPIGLAEVQGYSYAALRGAAYLCPFVREPGLDPQVLLGEAETLHERFNDLFWDEAASSFVVGLVDQSTPIDSVTTNPGHAMWCGLADVDLANRYLDRCLDDLWTGWGLRTLSPSAAAYNPLSYHNGSVWPHDTAAGDRRCGRARAARRRRTPGERVTRRRRTLRRSAARALRRDQPRRISPHRSTTRTRRAPQAWASASILMNLRSTLGLAPPARPGDPPVFDVRPGHAFDAVDAVGPLRRRRALPARRHHPKNGRDVAPERDICSDFRVEGLAERRLGVQQATMPKAPKPKTTTRSARTVSTSGGETHQIAGGAVRSLTTQQGVPVADDQNTLRAGDVARRCWRTSTSARRSSTSITSGSPSASSTPAASASTATSRPTSRSPTSPAPTCSSAPASGRRCSSASRPSPAARARPTWPATCAASP